MENIIRRGWKCTGSCPQMYLGGIHPINQFSFAILLLTCKNSLWPNRTVLLCAPMSHHHLPATREGVPKFLKYSECAVTFVNSGLGYFLFSGPCSCYAIIMLSTDTYKALPWEWDWILHPSFESCISTIAVKSPRTEAWSAPEKCKAQAAMSSSRGQDLAFWLDIATCPQKHITRNLANLGFSSLRSSLRA